MRNTFIQELANYAKKDPDIIMIAGDLGYNVLSKFYDELPKQFINAGIAEQNMSSMATGIALEGKKVYTYSIANFPTLRCIEQIRNDILYHDANVKIISVGAGLGYGSLGMSHHGTDDLGVMRCLPNIIIFSPCDGAEAKRICKLCQETNMPAYVRLGKGGEPAIHSNELKFNIGDSIKVLDGTEIAIFTTGPIASEAFKAAQELNKKGISTAFYTFPTIKPIDEATIKECGKKFKLIISVEENNIIGGLASAVSEILSEQNNHAALLKIGIKDRYISEIGNQEYLRKICKLDCESIVKQVLDKMEKISK